MASGASQAADPEVGRLLAKGWREETTSPCANLAPNAFYEVEGEDGNGEFYLAEESRALTASPSWPQEPRTCRSIDQPNFIQEVP